MANKTTWFLLFWFLSMGEMEKYHIMQKGMELMVQESEQKPISIETLTLIKNFGILYRTFLSYLSKSIESLDVSFSDCVFLVNIGEREGISQEEISSNLAINNAAIARSVKKMEQMGYVYSKKSVSDKRAKELYLSETGQILFRIIIGFHEEWLKQVLEDMDQDKVRDFAKTIKSISEKAKKS